MKLSALVKVLHEFSHRHQKRLFALRELAWLAHESLPSVGMTLLRAQRQGIVGRVGRLWLNLLDRPTIEEVALTLHTLSYVSFESALYHHGILSQAPRGLCSVATMGRPRKIATPVGTIEYIHLAPHLFFGFDATRVAIPEKALLDLAYIRIRRGLTLQSEVFYFDRLNRRRLSRMLQHYPKRLRATLASRATT